MKKSLMLEALNTVVRKYGDNILLMPYIKEAVDRFAAYDYLAGATPTTEDVRTIRDMVEADMFRRTSNAPIRALISNACDVIAVNVAFTLADQLKEA